MKIWATASPSRLGHVPTTRPLAFCSAEPRKRRAALRYMSLRDQRSVGDAYWPSDEGAPGT
jgi:hypothetical protein